MQRNFRTSDLYGAARGRTSGPPTIGGHRVVDRGDGVAVVEYREGGRRPEGAIITTPHPRGAGWRLAFVILGGAVLLALPVALWVGAQYLAAGV